MNRAAEIMWQKATIFAQRSEVIKKITGRRTAAVQDASRYMVLTLIPTGFGLRLSFCRFCAADYGPIQLIAPQNNEMSPELVFALLSAAGIAHSIHQINERQEH